MSKRQNRSQERMSLRQTQREWSNLPVRSLGEVEVVERPLYLDRMKEGQSLRVRVPKEIKPYRSR